MKLFKNWFWQSNTSSNWGIGVSASTTKFKKMGGLAGIGKPLGRMHPLVAWMKPSICGFVDIRLRIGYLSYSLHRVDGGACKPAYLTRTWGYVKTNEM